jgi:parallel beta-helix repeat protein
LSAWGFDTSGDQGYIGVDVRTSSGALQRLDATVTEASYTWKTVSFTTPSDLESVLVWSWKNAGPGYLYVDDYAVVEHTVQPDGGTGSDSSSQGAGTKDAAPPADSGAPLLTNPQNPVSYGADSSGTSDATSAFQAAIGHGDLHIPAGTFLINGTVAVPSNRTIVCDTGAVLKETLVTSTGSAVFQWNGTTGGHLWGCTFRGPNAGINGKPTFTGGMEWNFFVLVDTINGSGGGVTVQNNVFDGASANSAVQLYGNDATGPVTGCTIDNNEFKHCGYYGVAVVSGTNNHVGSNTLIDCSLGSEADDLGQKNTGNVYENNSLTFVYGNGWLQFLLTGGAAPSGFNYSGNIVRNNSVQGPGSRIYELQPSPGTPAQYSGNTCTNGCSVVH